MHWLSDLINYSGYWAPLKIIYPALMLVSGIWVYLDAQTRTSNGCFWGALAFAVPPIGVPLYYIGLLSMHIRDYDPAFKSKQQQNEMREQERRRRTAMGDIEKIREEQARDPDGGTMFDPLSGHSVSREGFKHFSDQRAEELLGEMKHEEAWDYLSDLYLLAREEGDGRAMDTYRHYISRIPGGLKRLKKL